MKVLYFTFIENPFAPETLGVMRNQVINLLKILGKKHYNISITWLALVDEKFYRPDETQISLLKEELRKCNVQFIYHTVKSGIINSRWSFAESKLKEIIESYQPDIVHARVYPAGYVSLKVRQKFKFSYRVLFAPRGVYPEQVMERSDPLSGWFRYILWKQNEKYLLQQSDLISCVSQPFIDHYKKIDKKAKLRYIPCCFNPDYAVSEETTNKDLKELIFKETDFIFVYSGNLSARYSSENLIVEFFSQISKIMPEAALLILTKSPVERIKSKLKAINLIHRVQFIGADPPEMFSYLSNCNAGLLLRRESLVNEVAMPTKFAEYLYAGLPVIVSPSLKGVSEFISATNTGIVIDPHSIKNIKPDYINSIKSIDRNNCKNQVERFTVSNIAEMVYSEYLNLLDI
jgi:glycosyltransferase involved in cell wall biosynthesis